MDIQHHQQLTKRERRELRHREQRGIEETSLRHKRFKNFVQWFLGTLILVIVLSFFIWYISMQLAIPESKIISPSGLHWHPELTIYVNGVKQELSVSGSVDFGDDYTSDLYLSAPSEEVFIG